jgi:hypothetical protein
LLGHQTAIAARENRNRGRARPVIVAVMGPTAASRWTAAVLVGLVALTTDLMTAHGGARLDGLPGGSVQEGEHAITVRMDAALATVEVRQTVINPGSDPRGAVYTFELPARAAVIGLEVAAGKRKATSVAVDVRAAVETVADPDAVGGAADAALLRLLERTGQLATYELRLADIAPGDTATVTLRWVAPLRLDDGRAALRIPGRGESDNLVRERVSVSVAGTVSAVTAAGAEVVASRGRYAFVAPVRGDIVIEAARPQTASAAAVTVGTARLDDQLGAIAIAVTVPGAAREALLDFDRIVVIVDVSRSMTEAGALAAARLADAIYNAAPGGAGIEAILFDRTARRALGRIEPNDAGTRKAIAEALTPPALDNGSDLGAALALAGPLVTSEDGSVRSLLVVISDGMVPLSLGDLEGVARVGTAALDDAQIASIALVPDVAPLPDTTAGPVAELARLTGGRSLALRHGEAAARAPQLAGELLRPAPLTHLSLEAGETRLFGFENLPDLDAGAGTVAIGLYRGPRPTSVTLTARRAGEAVTLQGRNDRGLGDRAAALALALAVPEDLEPPDQTPTQEDIDEARRLLVAATAEAGAVGPETALVALDTRDALARDRRRMLDRWGPAMFQRLPSAGDRDATLEARFVRRETPAAGAAPARRTGTLDRDIIERLIQTYVLPRARACYQKGLQRDPSLEGRVVMELELARGEVQHARLRRSTLRAGAIDDCLLDAAYSVAVPAVAQGDDPEAIGLVRYPIVFRAGKVEGTAPPDDGDGEVPIDVDEPLGDMERD